MNLPPNVIDKCTPRAGSFVEFHSEDVEQSIPQRFEQQARKYPEKVAVKTEAISLTYQMLDRQANVVAQAILSLSEARDEPIGLLFDPGARMIAAMLGVLKSGKMYVPLNAAYPIPRLRTILQDAGIRILVNEQATENLASNLGESTLTVLNIDRLDLRFSSESPGIALRPDTFAYILYTSGSTGKPKGIVQNHRNVLHNTMVFTNHLRISADDRLTLLHSYSYGACINDLFGALLNGATLLPFDVKQRGAVALGDFLEREQLTIYHSVPEVFRSLIQTLNGKHRLSSLRVLHLSGATVSKWDVELYRRHCPSHCVFVHRLGSTEAQTVFIKILDKDTKINGNFVPLGMPVAGKTVSIVDNAGQKVETNDVGELVIESRYLSPGYWHYNKETKAAALAKATHVKAGLIYHTGDLVRISPDGSFEHLGRKDSQIKIRGHRIDLAEIEVTLLNSGWVKEVAIDVREVRSGEKGLIVYAVPAREPAPSMTELREFLKSHLPSYMVPSAWVITSHLPYLPNGKIDRRALGDLDLDRSQLEEPVVSPRSPVENKIADIWRNVFGSERIGVSDNFLDLGGHSLLATNIITSIRTAMQIDLPFRAIFDHPTIEELALIVTEELLRQEQGEIGAGPSLAPSTDLFRVASKVN